MIGTFVLRAGVCAALLVSVAAVVTAQRKPKTGKAAASHIKVIDMEGLKKAVRPNGKPLLVNFWATWCDPCREEFPDLVKIHEAYKGKVDIITISLDNLSELTRDVPAFLAEMKATMPAYLLHTPDENAAIALLTTNTKWTGSLPMTALIKADGKNAYVKLGKIKYAIVSAEIDKILLPKPPAVTPTQ
jgi:thiol-disulfide isomerase/thioredoxin